MSRHGLLGIGQVIKANTTEKSIDDLRAEGKKRVRVVSSERVMAIIQAIVDDTIAAEVGEITKRDRDRIVNDTQDRFSRVLKMQQDLEQDVDDLRGSLRAAEAERERLRADKAILESQLEAARRADGESDVVTRLTHDLARVRDSVDRMSQVTSPSVVEIALRRVAEDLAARDAQAARRVGAQFEELRERVASVGRDATASRDAAIVTVLERVTEQQTRACAPIADRVDRAVGTVSDQIAQLTSRVDGSLRSLREDVSAFAEHAAAANETPAASLTGAVDELRAQTAESAVRSAQAEAAIAARLDASHAQLRAQFESLAAQGAESAERQHQALRAVGEQIARRASSDSAAQAEQAHAALAARLDDSVAELRGQLGALAAQSAATSERQHEAVRALGAEIARKSSAESDAMQKTFKSALDRALDQITKTMQAATARPIEMSVEATDVLLSKIFDDPDSVLSSNLDQLDVKERRTSGGIAKSVARLKQLNSLAKSGAAEPA